MQNMIELKSEMERLLSSLGGVIAARAVFNDDDEIVEIHVLSDLSKSPKQLVRDIQSASMAAFGLDIDYKLISIAQVNNDMVAPAVTIPPRLVIRKIMIGLDSQSLETTVILGCGDKSYEGSSKGPLTARSRINAAASASIAALKKYLGPVYNLSLVDTQRVTMAGSECFVVALSYADINGENVRYGVAPINGPETEVQAIVKAILSAVNRPISRPDKH